MTGAAGFIGAHLVFRLLKEGMDVHALVRPTTDLFRIAPVLPNLTLHLVDLGDFDRLKQTVKQISPHAIFHSAVGRGDDFTLLQNTLIGSFHLLKATEKIDYESFLHLGSSLEYGHRETPLSESDLLFPTHTYGAMKACSGILAEQHAKLYQRPLSILRIFSVYGPLEPKGRLIPTAIDAALQKKNLPLTEPGIYRDFIFVEDVVDACMACWKQKGVGQIYNVGTGVQTANEEVVTTIEKITGVEIEKQIGAYHPHPTDTMHWKADISKIEKWTGWKPQYNLESGLEKTLAYACSQRNFAHL